MTPIQDPGDPEPYVPPKQDDDEDEERLPFERPPFDRDPEAQRAPGAGEDEGGGESPPMQAGADAQ